MSEQRMESAPARLARRAIEAYIREGRKLRAEDIECYRLKEPAPVFVSLKKRGDLRGCVGSIAAANPSLGEEIVANAIAAATADPRFWPVSEEELPELQISVDVLSPMEPVAGMSDLDPERYGVLVRKGSRVGLLLPSIEGVESASQQLEIACRKAGIWPNEEGLEIFRFTVERYH